MNLRKAICAWVVVLVGLAGGRVEASPHPWVDDPEMFLNNAGARRWVIGRSTAVCLTEIEAIDSACRDAAVQMAATAGALAGSTLFTELRRGRFVTDRSLIRVRKPYADIWTGAVLVDASPANMRAIATEHAEARRYQQRVLKGRALSILGVCAMILLVYAGANAMTKGYFRGPLRAVAVMALMVVGCVAFRILWTSGG